MSKDRTLRLALLLAAFSALGPFTVDMYLSSLPDIMDDFGTTASMVQASLTASLLGLGLGQMIMGPVSDSYGRRSPLLIAMVLYIVSSIGCAFAPSVDWFIAIRFIQGAAASAGLVISRAIVRDRFEGAEMARLMSLVLLVFLLMPPT